VREAVDIRAIRNRSILAGALLAALATVSCGEEPAGEQHPGGNVIFISIDTLRADHLGCYGYPRDTSPELDEFSRGAVLFRKAIAQAPSTVPSHASMFTARIPAHHGASRSRLLPISPDVTTLAEILQRAGYRTISYNGGGQVSATFGFGRGFEVYESVAKQDTFAQKVDAAIDWLDANPGEKFFLFLHTYEPHAPYTPDPRYVDLVDAGDDGDPPFRIDPAPLNDLDDIRGPLDPQRVRTLVRRYDGEIRSMDEAFGRLIDSLVAKDLYDNTTVVFTSDHGEALGEHGAVAMHSHTLYDELLHVPLIVKLAGSRPASDVIEPQVRSIDIMPTLLELLGLESPAEVEGRSLVGLMDGEDLEPLAAVSQQDTSDPMPPSSIRTEERKLILRPAVLSDGTETFQWFRERAEFTWHSGQLVLPIASVDEGRVVDVLIDGEPCARATISPRRGNLELYPRGGAESVITVLTTTPCVGAAQAGIDADEDCVSFRLFNPYEFYRLDRDPGEQDDRYQDAVHGHEIAELRRQLARHLAGAIAATGREQLELDEETKARLKALGYIR
jgi:hypothetical protein